MDKYIGTKIVRMKSMTRGEYNLLRGWELPSNENYADEGYLVECTDGGEPNDPRFEGYISWSPKEQAEAVYRLTTGMSFGLAIEALKKGLKVTRRGWNGKNMWLVLMPELNLPAFDSQEKGAKVNDRTAKYIGESTPLNCNPYIAMWTADAKWQPGWLASQTDMLADDWQVVE